MHQHEIPTYPWQYVCADLFKMAGNEYLFFFTNSEHFIDYCFQLSNRCLNQFFASLKRANRKRNFWNPIPYIASYVLNRILSLGTNSGSAFYLKRDILTFMFI